jgi:hypothetical protein
MRRLLLLSIWSITTPLTLIISLYLYTQISSTKALGSLFRLQVKNLVRESPYVMFSSLPATVSDIRAAVKAGDARPVIVENFLNGGPLAPFARQMVEISDNYGLDFRLLPAIAMAESGGGRAIPEDSCNAWGWGIYGDQVIRFESWTEAIKTVAYGIKTEYLDLGLDTPEKMMPKYAPPSVEKGGPWAKAVSSYMGRME